MAAKKHTLSEQLRREIVSADVSRYRISKDLGIPEASLSRFVNGHAGLSVESIDAIGQYLDLELVQRKAKPRKRKGK